MSIETSYPPSGCARCGHRERHHFLGRPLTPYHATGSHDYEPPTTEQIKERMLARRAPATAPGGSHVTDKPAPTMLDHATAQWHETNEAIGDASGHGSPPDPYRYAALLDERAGWWDRLGQLADQEAGEPETRDVYAIACSYAAILDREHAARVRYQHRIPSLHPGSDATQLGLYDNRCRRCDRPHQLDRDGACESCPDLLWGITPHSAEQAATYPPGQPWTPHEPWTAGGPLDGEDGGW